MTNKTLLLTTGLISVNNPSTIETGMVRIVMPMNQAMDSKLVCVIARKRPIPASSSPSVVTDTQRKYKLPPIHPSTVSDNVQASRLKNESTCTTLRKPSGVGGASSPGTVNASRLETPTGKVRIQLNQLKRLRLSTDSVRVLISSAGSGRVRKISSTLEMIEEYT